MREFRRKVELNKRSHFDRIMVRVKKSLMRKHSRTVLLAALIASSLVTSSWAQPGSTKKISGAPGDRAVCEALIKREVTYPEFDVPHALNSPLKSWGYPSNHAAKATFGGFGEPKYVVNLETQRCYIKILGVLNDDRSDIDEKMTLQLNGEGKCHTQQSLIEYKGKSYIEFREQDRTGWIKHEILRFGRNGREVVCTIE